MKKKLLNRIAVCAILLTLSQTLPAQSLGHTYRTALGVKFFPGAVSIKHFVRPNGALEGLGYFWDHGFRFTGLYEIHGNFNGAPGLKWYVGPGAHVGVYNESWYHGHYYYESGSLSLGVDGVLGMDYKINRAPIDLSADVQPSLEFITHPYLSLWGGLGVRYTF